MTRKVGHDMYVAGGAERFHQRLKCSADNQLRADVESPNAPSNTMGSICLSTMILNGSSPTNTGNRPILNDNFEHSAAGDAVEVFLSIPSRDRTCDL